MKSKRNMSIYFLSASLIFVGISNAQNSQGATSSSNQIASLQKQVKALSDKVDALSDKVDALTAINIRQSSKFSGLHDCLFFAVSIGGTPSPTPIYDCLWKFSIN